MTFTDVLTNHTILAFALVIALPIGLGLLINFFQKGSG